MERTKAITAAAVVSGALLAGSLGMTANAGILSGSGPDKAGQLSPLAATTTVVTAAAPSDVTAAVPAPSPDEPSVAETRASSTDNVVPTTAVPGSPMTATTAKPRTQTTTPETDAEPESEPPEATQPRPTAPPVTTSTTAPAPTTTTRAHRDDDGAGTGRDD